MLAGWTIAALGAARMPWTGGATLRDLAVFGATASGAVAVLLAALKAFRRPGLFGLRRPAGWSWLWLAPAAIAGALLGGAWMPAVGDPASLLQPVKLGAVLLLPLSAELAFRGLVQGLLMRRFRASGGAEGGWLPSWPAVLSAVLFTLWTVPFYLAGPAAAAGSRPAPVAFAGGALLLGLGLGMARERCESLLGPLALHYLGVGAALLAALLL